MHARIREQLLIWAAFGLSHYIKSTVKVLIFIFILLFLPATGCSFAVNSAQSSRFVINLLFRGTLTPGMWSQMFQLPPKMAQSRSPDSADAPDSEAVTVCMIYCFKGRPARRRGASEGASFFDLSCWTNARFHLRKWLAGGPDAVKGRPWFSGGSCEPPRLQFALLLPIFSHWVFSSSAFSTFVSSAMCHCYPYISRRVPCRSAFILSSRLVSPRRLPLFSLLSFFFSAVLLLSFHIYSLRQQL